MASAVPSPNYGPKPDFALRLEIFDVLREPGRRYTQEEIAEATGVSRGYIWWLQKRALAKLRNAMEKRLNQEGSVTRG